MPDKRGNLYIFEALILIKEYRARLQLLNRIINADLEATNIHSELQGENEYRLVPEVDIYKIKKEYEKFKRKERKLAIAINSANINYTINFEGEEISLSEALQLMETYRYTLINIIDNIKNACTLKIIHKEKRDITIKMYKQKYTKMIKEFNDKSKQLDNLERLVKITNYTKTVNFKDDD